MTNRWLRGLVYVAACMPAVLIVTEVARQHTREQTENAGMGAPPADVLAPASATVRLEGADLAAYLARKPVTVGSPAPRVRALDFQDRPVTIPPTDGRPTAWVVSCGCRECSSFITGLILLQEAMGNRVHTVAFVETRSAYVWGHHANTYRWKEIRLVRDPGGEALRLMKPPGADPMRLPTVWACDGRGIIRYVGRPDRQSDWLVGLCRSLKLQWPKRRG